MQHEASTEESQQPAGASQRPSQRWSNRHSRSLTALAAAPERASAVDGPSAAAASQLGSAIFQAMSTHHRGGGRTVGVRAVSQQVHQCAHMLLLHWSCKRCYLEAHSKQRLDWHC